MARQRLHQTAAGQASLLFVLAGILGLVSETLLIEESPRPGSIGLNIAAILFAFVLWAAPWHRWSPRTSLLAVPVALVPRRRRTAGVPWGPHRLRRLVRRHVRVDRVLASAAHRPVGGSG